MDSDAKSTKSEEDSSTKHVLDYYRKFSQNKDLPKYFSGTSVSYLPEIRDELEIQVPEIAITTDVDVIITTTDEAKQSEPVDLSPTSSIMSNRKLEWDNGADIGYSNYCLPTKKIHKSCSLPIISELLKPRQVAFNFAQPSSYHRTPESESSSGSNVKLIVFPYSSTSGDNSSEAKCCSSSSSFPEEKKDVVFSFSSTSASTNGVAEKAITTSSTSSSTSQKILSFKSTLSHLKKKIGLPDAQSTPNSLEDVKTGSGEMPVTPVMKNHEKPVKQLLLDEKYVRAKPSISGVEEIVKSKDVSDESEKLSTNSQQSEPRGEDIDKRNIERQIKRVVNLCLTKPMSVECISSPPVPMNKQIQTQTQQLSVAVQTDHISEKELIKIAVESQQNINQSLHFFEHHGGTNKSTSSTQTTTDIDVSKCESFEFVKPDSSRTPDTEGNEVQHQVYVNPDEIVETSQSSSQKVHLAEVISTSKLENFGEDIEKGIHILQKLLRSKKYDPATKKRYVKKIIRKITESKYLEESSASSELFFPKKSCRTEAQKISQPKLAQQSTDSSVEKSQQSEIVQSKFPRHTEEKVKPSPRKRTLEIKTFSQNIASNPILSTKDELSSPAEIIPVEVRDMRKNLFTLTNNEFSVAHYHQVLGASESANAEALASKKDTSLEKHFDSCSTSKSYHNWKQDKTLSEKVIEQKYYKIGDGDCLINFADKEREYQINWINREINQLGKLKHLLEKPPTSEPTGRGKTTTSVYSVSRKSDDTGDEGLKRKFVIETKLRGGSSGQRNFQLNGKKFTVANLSEPHRENKKPRPVLEDIEVTSSDTTTNIIVTTFCEICKGAPCICVEPTEHLAKENMCQRCRNRSCTCCVPNPIKSCETICLSCHKAPCSCSTQFSSTGAISKRCFLCRFYPCICSHGSKPVNYDGQFIPVIVPKLNLGGESEEELLFSSLSQTISKSSTGCGKCRKCPCLCSQSVRDSDSTSIEELTSKQSSESLSGSLSKVFVNCKCNAKSRCNCGFVEKLLRHFDKDDLFRNINFEDNSAQTDSGNRVDINDIGIQTQVDVRNQNLQTSSRQQSKVSQTDEIRGPQDPHDMSIQTLTQTRDQLSRGVGKKQSSSSVGVGKETISQCSAETQAVSQNGNTMTVGVQETVTEDEKKQDSSNTAVQTSVERQHQRVQGAEDWIRIFPSVAIETERISLRSAKTQAASQDQTTMTQDVRATSTDDRNKDLISVDEATSYDEKKLACHNFLTRDATTQNAATSEATTQDAAPRATLTRDASSGKSSIRNVSTRDATTQDAAIRDASTRYASTRKSSIHNVSTRSAATHDATTQDAATRDALTRDASSRKSLIRNVSARDAATHDATTQDAATRGASTRDASTRKSSIHNFSTRDAATHDATTRDGLTRDASSRKSLIRNVSTRDAATHDATTQDAATRDASSRKSLIRNVSARDATRDATTQDAAIRDASTRDASIRKSSINNVSTRDAATHDATTQDAATRDALTRNALTRDASVRNSSIGNVSTRVAATYDATTQDAATRDPLTRDASTRKSSIRNVSTRDAATGTLTRDTLIHDNSGQTSPELSSHKMISKVNQGRMIKPKDVENRETRDCACVCGFFSKVHHRDQGNLEKEPIQMESNSNAWNETSTTTTTNGTTSSETVTTQSETTSQVTCVCCRRRAASDHTSMLRSNNEDYPLCRRCVRKKPILTSVCYTGPEHVCTCTSPDGSKAAGDRFRRVEEYCTCTRPSRTHTGRYCCHCQFKLKRTQQSRNGIAYTLTLENESPRRGKSKRRKTKRLEEIKMKVPCPYNRKKRKDKENFSRRGESNSKLRYDGLEGEGEFNSRSELEGIEEDEKGEDREQEMKNKDNLSLQEYLKKNRPDFIDSAEYRRQAVVSSRTERQQATDDLKLRFIHENAQNNEYRGSNKLFTEKEMKEITKRNYKKLPEVQQRLNDFREKKLRNADKLIVDIFKRKIQGSVLKGKRSFPIDTNIVNIHT